MARSSRTRRRTLVGRQALRSAVTGVLGLAVVAGCSAPPAAPPTTAPAPPATSAPATYSPELCTAAAQFQTAANAIIQLDATKVGAEGVKAGLQALADAGRNLITAAGSQFGPQVDALGQALASLQATIASIGDQTTLSAELGALTASVAQVETAAAPIIDSVRTGCSDVPPVQAPPTS